MTKKELIIELEDRSKKGFYIPPYDILLSIYKEDEEIHEVMVEMCFHQPKPKNIDMFMSEKMSYEFDKALKDWISNDKEK